MAEKVTINVDAKTGKAQKALDDLNSSLEQVAETGDKNREGFEVLDKVTGGYAGKIKDLAGTITGAVKGAKAFATSLKGVRGALLATGIGAIVVALGTIIAYWDEIVALFDDGTKALQDQEQEHRDILATTQQELAVAENTQKILELQGKNTTDIIEEKKKLIKQQMSENDLLVENLKNQLEILLAEQKRFKLFRDKEEEAEEIAKVEEKINKAILDRQKLEINLLGIEKKASDDKKKADEDEKKRIEDANKKRKEDKEKADKEEEEAEKKKQEALERIRQGQINTEDERRKEELRKVKEQYDKLLEEARLYYGKDSEQAKALIQSRDEQIQEIKDKNAKTDKERQERLDKEEADKTLKKQEKKIEELELDKEFDALNFDEKRNLINERTALLQEDETLSQKQKNELLKKFSEARVEIDLQEKEAKAAVQLAALGVAEQGIGVLKDLAGDNVGVQKALLIAENAAGIAKILVNTNIANAKALSASPLTGGQPWVAINGISAGLGIASSIAATAKGLSGLSSAGSKVGASGGSGSVGSGGGLPAQPQAPSFNIVGATETSQLAESIGQQTQEPVQAYVVANDVTTAQSLNNNIVEGATL